MAVLCEVIRFSIQTQISACLHSQQCPTIQMLTDAGNYVGVLKEPAALETNMRCMRVAGKALPRTRSSTTPS